MRSLVEGQKISYEIVTGAASRRLGIAVGLKPNLKDFTEDESPRATPGFLHARRPR